MTKRQKRLLVFAVVLLSTVAFSGCGGNGYNPPPPPPDQKPTITISPTTATVELEKSQSFTLTLSGQPSPTVTCSAPQGIVSSNGNAVVYTAPADPPAQSWTPNVSCTAQNRAGTATATAQITLNYPVPVVNSINPPAIYLSADIMIIGGIEVRGSGFYAGGTFQVHNPDSPFGYSFTLAEGTARDKIGWITAFDTPHWAPMYLKITVSSPPGHGGGTSNPGWFAFLGNLNALAVSQAKAFFLYLGPVPGGEAGIGDRIRVYDLVTGAQVADFSIDSPGFVRQIAYDERSSSILTAEYWYMGLWDENGISGNLGGGVRNDDDARTMSISSLEGNACVSFPSTGKIGWVADLNLNDWFTLLPLSHRPWNVMMSKMGEQLLCAVFDIQDLQLSVIKIPQLELYRSLILNGLTPADQMWGQGDGPDGGWQLDVFKSGPAVNTAAVLSQTVLSPQRDRKVVFVDISSGTELRRVQLDGVPFRIAANNATGELIVAYADVGDGKTHFKKIAVATGEATNLSITTPEGVLATGLAVSTDGTKVYAVGYNSSGQPTFNILPIN